MPDSSSIIVTILLILSGITAVVGYDRVFQDGLDRQMKFWENRWENEVEKRDERWLEHCQIYAMGYANELGQVGYDPEEPMRVFRDCMTRYPKKLRYGTDL